MFRRFYPDEAVESAYGIPYEKLYEDGVRGILYDIDNTLVEHGADATAQAVELVRHLRQMGFSVMFLSNNDEERVRRFNREIGAKYIYKAGKPSPKAYVQAMREMGTDASKTVFIGDQLFTDIWGAKRAGIRTYLVRPVAKHEEIQIVLKRRLEAVVLFFYRRHRGKRTVREKDGEG